MDGGNYKMEVEEAMNYLRTGGLGEVIGFTDIALRTHEPKVQMDTDMAMALCLFADEAIKANKTPLAA